MASDTADNLTLASAINSADFQTRCRLRFIVAAVSVMAEDPSVINHSQRAAFAGAIFAGHVNLDILASVIVANSTNRTNCLADLTRAGGVINDSDIDFQINSVFTGIATSRNWELK